MIFFQPYDCPKSLATFWGFVSGGVKDALTFGLRLMFVDITEP